MHSKLFNKVGDILQLIQSKLIIFCIKYFKTCELIVDWTAKVSVLAGCCILFLNIQAIFVNSLLSQCHSPPR